MPDELDYYIEDDWNDDKLTDRDDPEKGLYYAYSEGGTGDLLKGVYRPRWDARNHSYTTEDGYLSPDSTNEQDQMDVLGLVTTHKNIAGSFSFDFNPQSYVSGEQNGSHYFAYLADDGSNKYSIQISTDDQDGWRIDKVEGGSSTAIVDAGTGQKIEEGTYETIKATRSSYGEHELFIGGTSEGTATDTYLPERPKYLGPLRTENSPEGRYDNLVVE